MIQVDKEQFVMKEQPSQMQRLAPAVLRRGNVLEARPGADSEINRLPEIVPLVTEDLSRGSHRIQVQHHNAESGNDLFPTDKKVQRTRQFVAMATVGVGQPLLCTEQTVPRVETSVEVNVFVAFRGAVSIFDAVVLPALIPLAALIGALLALRLRRADPARFARLGLHKL
jgi:hypothetical protein